MKKAMAVLAVLSLVAFAGQVAVNLDPVQETDADWLTYFNGSPHWLTWGGTYRGTWFNAQDFIPGAGSGEVMQSEFWFFHHSSYPWDTSDVYLELWNGDAMGPMTQLDQTMKTAVHYSQVLVTYPTPVGVEQNFWGLANTELSAGGWPAILADNTQGSTGIHSFYSDDFIVWEPWDLGNFWIGVYWEEVAGAFDNTTWGALKATF